MASGHLHKRGKVWYARYQDESGTLRWKSLKTNSKDIARAKIARLLEALEKAEVGWRLNPKLIADYLKEYLQICETEHSQKTYRVEKQILEDFIGFIGVQYLHQVMADKIEAYKIKRAKEVSKSTINRALGVIKAFLNRAVALNYLERNPSQFVKRLKEEQKHIEFVSDDNLKKLLKACSPRVREIVTVFVLTGMRLGELCHLRWEDIDFRHKQIIIQNQSDWTTKSRKPRIIPMHPIIENILERLPQGGKFVFPTRNDKPVESYIRGEILRYAKKVGVRANVKMFRSTFASNLVMSGVDVFSVSKILGHHDVKLTEKHYAHLTPDYLKQSVARLNLSAYSETKPKFVDKIN